VQGRTFIERLKDVVIGKERNLADKQLFHRVSLIAIFAWVGLGADGLSSSCYGPEEAFKALGLHGALAPFVALATVLTIAIICMSYAQIIEVFPGGGGGYLVASKLLSPAAGVVSGCALLVDYVLTIALSIASGADALFSMLSPAWLPWKLPFALVGVAFLTLLNLRGVRESVMLWVPVFFIFIATHAFAIVFGIGSHMGDLTGVARTTTLDLAAARSQLGWLGIFVLLIKAYSVGAGTYTGIEAVSNGLSILREPRVATGKRTMLYMGVSLGLTVGGLLMAYLLYRVQPVAGKTLNAVLFSQITASWPAGTGSIFVGIALLSAMALLFVAAQTGFLDGPRVLSNMALDRWFPGRFASLSDRLVTQNGILLMGAAAMIVLAMTRGAVGLMVVLYSINVFITFTLSQLGMMRHWWQEKKTARGWQRKLTVNSIGFCLTGFILVALSATKFHSGGWITLFVTGLLVGLAFMIRAHYRSVLRQLARLDDLVKAFETDAERQAGTDKIVSCDPGAKTAVIFVNGFNGLGIHTLLAVQRMFPGVYRNFIFVQVGTVDAGNFKGSAELDRLCEHIKAAAGRYAEYMRRHGFYAEAVTAVGADTLEMAGDLAIEISKKFSQATFFGGQLVFRHETMLHRLLHNYFVFSLQRKLFSRGFPFLILPIRV
jgi:amino acid transporter